MMINLTPIAISIISLLSVAASAYLIPWLKSKLGNEKMTKLQNLVMIGVSSAEQLAKTGIINKEDRKNHVLEFLKSNGYTADMNLIEEMIEAAVNDMF